MAARNNIFTTIRTEGALLPADLLQRISEGQNIEGLTPDSYHHGGEKLNEVINRSWNALQGAWASFKAAQERLPENDLGTTITRERWLLPLFRELDYGRLQTATAVEIDGRTYPISHSWEHVPVHLVSYKLELDKRTPGAAGAASASPHSLLQVFLNRSENNLWGFLSNGYRLRILRDNASLTRQAYVEFDLQAMMEGEVYSDFVLLWLLCHQSRVEGDRPSDCWLEKWMKVAEDQGTRALDQLRNGVEAAIEALGVGFLDYPSNATLRDKLTSGELKKEEYYRQLLRMVYRLLFLFVAEDRSLLLNPNAPQDARERYIQYYSTQRLRHVAESFKGTRHPDLFESLRLVMRLLSGDDPHLPTSSPSGGRGDKVPRPEGEGFRVRVAADGLGLIPLGSFLFSDRAVTDIIDCQISNQHLLDAIRALSLTYDQRTQIYRTVDYRNLGSDELGSVFESLLELHPQINIAARTFALSTAAGNERKTTGSYYTPESLVHALLDSALNPVLEEAMKGKDPQPPAPSPSGRRGVNAFGAAPSATGGAGALSAAASERGGNEPVWRTRASEAMHQISKELRGRQTPAEVILWEALRDRRLDGLKFRRQHAIANTAYVADFLCYEARLVIELDGGIHQHHREEDAIRQQNIEAEGYTVIRFTNEQVYTDPESVLTAILSTARSSSPLPEGEGLGVRVNYPEGEGFRVGATAEERILNLKVCDPACGSGHFLIAAANRIAKVLATVRTGEEEPTPAAIQEAKRDVISHCIYGVDINPMAVELCKVNLWMEALEPGKPLNFLDHRIQVGNSLLGTTPRLMADGIPDDAFNPIEGDDKSAASALKKKNRDERKQREANVRQLDLFGEAPRTADYAHLTDAMHALDDTPDDTLDSVRRKEAQYAALANDPEYIKARLLADAWCAAFVWEKRPSPPQSPSPSWRGVSSSLLPAAGGHEVGEGSGMRVMTDLLYRRMEENPLADNLQPVREYVVELKDRYQFFHWHVAFPDVFTVPDSPLPSETRFAGEGAGGEGQTGWHGGFDVVLGNPPWERIKIQEKEWFAERAPEIASAPNAAARRRAIAALAESDPHLLQAFADDKRKAEGESHFVRISGRYPLTGRGDVNTYTLFAESSRLIMSALGRMGMIVPSGIATDDTTKFFFQDLMQTRTLASLYDFENREGIFEGVHRSYKFCLLTLTGFEKPVKDGAQFVFFALNVGDLNDPEKRFTLSAEDIAIINPTSKTSPIFRNSKEAALAKRIYSLIPVLIDESINSNPWGIAFHRVFDMTNDSHLFKTRDDMEISGYDLAGNVFVGSDKWLPVIEGKMVTMYDHRAANIELNTENASRQQQPKINSLDTRLDPNFVNLPYLWAEKSHVEARNPHYWNYQWYITFKRVTAATNERTVLGCIVPKYAISYTLYVVTNILENIHLQLALTANLYSLVSDYCVRQKTAQPSLPMGVVYESPFIPPHTYTPALLDFIVPRVLELTYTAWDLAAFAADVGWDGPPFIWDEERRFLMRCELDALYFHLYQISRDDVDYIMETFPIVKRKDEAKHGEYLTKRVILEMYDQMAGLAKVVAPAPKDESATYLVPDVSQWETWLNPPPASPDVAHEG